MSSNISIGVVCNIIDKGDYKSENEKLTSLLSDLLKQSFKCIYVCGTEDFTKELKLPNSERLVVLVDDSGKDNFQSKVNTIVDKSNENGDEYISFVNHKDKLYDKFHNVCLEYIKTYPEYNVFLPIVNRTTVDNALLDTINIIGWAASLYEEAMIKNIPLGVINFGLYEMSPQMIFEGILIKVSTFLEVGRLKTNMEYAYAEEFFYRLLHLDNQIVNMNYSGYQFIFETFDFDQERMLKWIDIAKKEYHFTSDRELTIV